MRIADPNAPTKEKILAAARKLMLEKGFTATSIEDICVEARATKGSFFHFFTNKEDMAKAALESFVCDIKSFFDSASFQELKDPKARLLGRIDASIAVFNDPKTPKSCLLGNFSQELAPTHPGFQALCAEKFAQAGGAFTQDAAAVLPRAQAERLANLYLAIIQGSLVLIKAKRDVSVAVENLRQFRSYVESLMEANR